MFTSIRPVAAKAWRAASSLQATSLGRLSSRVTIPRRQLIVVPGRSSVLSVRGFATTKGRSTKKTAAKKSTVKKTTAKKTTKKVAAKPKPKKVRKVLTPEEKKKLEIRELRKIALFDEPAQLPASAWVIHVTSSLKGQKVGRDGLASSVKPVSDSYQALSAGELQNLKDTAEQNKLSNNAAYKAWVESHTPKAIYEANKARNRLAKTFKQPVKALIKDDRQPKRPSSAYNLFNKARWASGDFTNHQAPEVARILAVEWKALDAHERQAYEDLAKAELERYEREVQSVLGRTIKKRPTSA